jgi:hypothetical protein
MKIEELFQANPGDSLDFQAIIAELKSKRGIPEADTSTAKAQLEPTGHEIFDRVKRPDKKVRVDTSDPDQMDQSIQVTSSQTIGYRNEPVARVALALQKLIVRRAVSFLFGNPVLLNADTSNEKQKSVLKALKRVLMDAKEKSLNRRVARTMFSCTEVAELWYPIESPNEKYGFKSKLRLRCVLLSPLDGDKLYPYFDDTGDMVAFSRDFSINHGKKKVDYFETYTDDMHYLWEGGTNGYEPAEGYPQKNMIGKIPVIFGRQGSVEWLDVQILIERLEKLLSNFADTNDYHAAPKIFVKGNIIGFSKKGESGAIIEGDTDSSATYLSWKNAPESVKLEIDTLLRFIYTITQTPDISFDSVKGIGTVSGVALKLLFMDAHLKVMDHQEVFDEYLQRRINLIKAYIGQFNTALTTEADNLQVEPEIVPYLITDLDAEIKIWQDANGGNPIMSQKASFQKAALTKDPEADYKQYQQEQSSKSSFTLGEPTLA